MQNDVNQKESEQNEVDGMKKELIPPKGDACLK